MQFVDVKTDIAFKKIFGNEQHKEILIGFLNSEVPDGFSAKGLEQASKELDLMKLSDADRKLYERYIDDCRSAESSIETSWLEGHGQGFEKGIEKGKSEGKIEIAIEMIRDGELNDKISKYTGLTDDEIEA